MIFTITGSPREYLDAYMFPVLLPAIEQMLVAAKENKVFEVCFSFKLLLGLCMLMCVSSVYFTLEGQSMRNVKEMLSCLSGLIYCSILFP